jgi:hypothetical protein
MSSFQTKKIKLEKVENKEGILYFVDYFKYKEADSLLVEIFCGFADGKKALIVIDTDSFYDRKASATEQKIVSIKKELTEERIEYREVIVKKEGNTSILGIKIPSSSKVNSYKLAIATTPEQIEKLMVMFHKYNVFCYIPDSDLEDAVLYDKFDQSRGNIEELSGQFGIGLYNDSYFRRIRISSNKDTIQIVREKLQKYE